MNPKHHVRPRGNAHPVDVMLGQSGQLRNLGTKTCWFSTFQLNELYQPRERDAIRAFLEELLSDDAPRPDESNTCALILHRPRWPGGRLLSKLGKWWQFIFEDIKDGMLDDAIWERLQSFHPGVYGRATHPLALCGGRDAVIKRLRHLSESYLVGRLEIGKSGHIHLHTVSYTPGDNGKGVTQSVVGLLFSAEKHWIRKAIIDSIRPVQEGMNKFTAFKLAAAYVSTGQKDGAFPGYWTYGELPPSFKEKVEGNALARDTTASSVLMIRDQIRTGVITQRYQITALFSNGEIDSGFKAVEKSLGKDGMLTAMLLEKQRETMTKNLFKEILFWWIYGPSGCGKNRFIEQVLARKWIEKHFPCSHTEACNCWCTHMYEKSGATKWWPGYTGQPLVSLVETRMGKTANDPQKWTYAELLRLIDRSKETYVETKGGQVLLMAQVFVLSNTQSLRDTMPAEDQGLDTYDQLLRRCNMELRFTSAPHADPSDWQFDQTHFNPPVARDHRNLAALRDWGEEAITAPEESGLNARESFNALFDFVDVPPEEVLTDEEVAHNLASSSKQGATVFDSASTILTDDSINSNIQIHRQRIADLRASEGEEIMFSSDLSMDEMEESDVRWLSEQEPEFPAACVQCGRNGSGVSFYCGRTMCTFQEQLPVASERGRSLFVGNSPPKKKNKPNGHGARPQAVRQQLTALQMMERAHRNANRGITTGLQTELPEDRPTNDLELNASQTVGRSRYDRDEASLIHADQSLQE